MKNIKRILSLFAIVIALLACEEENKFPSSDIAVTTVYSVTAISNSSLEKINIYREKALAINYVTEVNVFNFATSGYSDASTETEIIFEWTTSEERIIEDDEGEEQIIVITVLRKVNASKDDGMGTMDTTITLPDGTIEETTHTVTVIEEQVYN